MNSNSSIKITEWQNCYKDSWKNVISEGAFMHPAKFSRGLIFKIVEYALEQGYIEFGNSVLDCFGGVGLGALPCSNAGLPWAGCELEPLFWVSGHRNFEKWVDKFWCACGWEDYLTTLRDWLTSKDDPKPVEDTPQVSMFDLIEPPQLDSAALWARLIELVQIQRVEAIDRRSIEGQFCAGCGKVIAPYPVLLQGDSRFLSSILGQVGAVVSSPPYIDTDVGGRGGEGPGAAGNAAQRSRIKAGNPNEQAAKAINIGYHDSPGQLGSMPAGEYDSVISSPAYGSGEKGHPSLGSVNQDNWGSEGTNIAGRRGKDGKYGNSDSQLANLPDTGYDAVISSSPFVSSLGSDNPDKRGGLLASDPKRRNDANLTGTYGDDEANLGTMAEGEYDAIITSPPYADSMDSQKSGIDSSKFKDPHGKTTQALRPTRYGDSDGQLGSLPDKDYDLVIGSPSWAGNSGGQGDASRNAIEPGLFDRHQGGMKRGTGDGEPGNIDHMAEGDYSAVVSSPPFGDVEPTKDDNFRYNGQPLGSTGKHYGQTPNQLGNQSGVTFWAASRDILLETHKVLRKGGYTFWVVKRYIKAGQIIEFDNMWLKLCQVCGFEHVETIYAWQVEDKGSQYDSDGIIHNKIVKRKSFFRILFEKNNPDKAIDYEVVLILKKL